MSLFTALIDASDACNLACGYCYRAPGIPGRLPLAAFDRLATELAASLPRERPVLAVWHGAEPLTLEPGYFLEANARLARVLGDRLKVAVQTNGVLLDDAWLDALHCQRASVSISLDGPARHHDRQRRSRDGQGSFECVLAGIARLRGAGIPFGILTTLTPDLACDPDGYFELLRAVDAPARIGPCVVPDDDPLALAGDAWGQFVIAVAERWLTGTDRPLDLEPLRTLLLSAAMGEPLACCWQSLCFDHQVALAPDGGLYPCVRLLGSAPDRLGDLARDGLAPALTRGGASPAPRLPGCSDCGLSAFCHGGCAWHARVRGRPGRGDGLCASWQAMYRWLFGDLVRILPRMARVRGVGVLDAVADALTARKTP
jgi:uncharacterized protein